MTLTNASLITRCYCKSLSWLVFTACCRTSYRLSIEACCSAWLLAFFWWDWSHFEVKWCGTKMERKDLFWFFLFQFCVFQPAFRCCMHPKAGRNTFFGPFLTFFLNFNVFQWIFTWKQEETFKNIWKKCFKLLFKAGRHANAGGLPEGVTQFCLYFDQLSSACSAWKLVQIHNIWWVNLFCMVLLISVS